jgi:hypothetical protein
MYIAIIIIILISSAAVCGMLYFRGYDKGGRDMLDTLSHHGRASLLSIPYEQICEEYADHIGKYVLTLKRVHEERMTNRRDHIYAQYNREYLYKKDGERKAQ